MKQFNLFFLFFVLTIHQSMAQSGCPGCVVDLPVLPEDTIFLSDAMDGQVGVYYDGNLSFRMPKTTDPVNASDPGTPAGLNISEITILSMVNVPPGLSWEPSQTTFDTGEETDGCVKFCGIPLVSDTFEIGVVVEAQVSIFTQTASFTFKMYIAPATSTNDGFSANNTQGCGEVIVDFSNNIPSNGQDGFSYFWDFGNGSTSILEQPSTQIYNQPGIYEVNYEATIDTVGFVLTSVDILDDDCGDLIGGADIFIRIRNPMGEVIFSTNPISDTPIPINIPVNIVLSDFGDYKLEVRDEDPLATEDCGDIYFMKDEGGTHTDGGLEVVLNIFHPVFTVTSTDTIVVLETPDLPMVVQSSTDPICSGSSLELTTDYLDNIQWFQDSALLFGANDPVLEVNEPGIYWVQYTADNGCQVISEAIEIDFLQAPATPVHSNFQNLLSLNDEDELPENYSAQWYLNGNPIPFADELFYCIKEDGSYTLTIFDEDNGCASSYTFSYIYNPDFECTATGTEDTFAHEIGLQIFPNPSNGQFNLRFQVAKSTPVAFQMMDTNGRLVWSKDAIVTEEFAEEMNFSTLPSGIYFLRIMMDEDLLTQKLIIE